jgi:ATP phosphoribosyltransferase regulatory subunit
MNINSENTQKTLLPQGFHDILPPNADVERQTNKTLLDSFALFGYQLVRPAMLEFEDETSSSSQAQFRVTDPISGKMLCLRNDITPQISRIASDRFEFNGQTTRLAYTGQVIRKHGKGRHTERQLTQTGVELLGQNNINQDAEILYIALECLENLKINEFTVDFCIPQIINEILEAEKLSKIGKQKIIDLIEKKDFAELSKIANKNILKILDLCSSSTSENYAEILDKICSLEISANSKKLVTELKNIISKIFADGKKFNLSIDVLEQMGFEYHSGICFSIFSNKNHEEICRGGRYQIVKNSKNIDAVGCTFLVNSLCRVTEFKNVYEIKQVSYSNGFGTSANLRKQGVVTIFE